jgi:hypothetical protein
MLKPQLLEGVFLNWMSVTNIKFKTARVLCISALLRITLTCNTFM